MSTSSQVAGRASSRWTTIGRSTSGMRAFGRLKVRGRSRRPRPPAMITSCIRPLKRGREGFPFFGQIGVAAVRVTDGSRAIGDTVEIQGPTTNVEQTVDSLQIEHATVSTAGAGQEVGMKVRDRVREKDFVYKLVPSTEPAPPKATRKAPARKTPAKKAPAKKPKRTTKKARGKKARAKKSKPARKATRATRSKARRGSRKSRRRSR